MLSVLFKPFWRFGLVATVVCELFAILMANGSVLYNPFGTDFDGFVVYDRNIISRLLFSEVLRPCVLVRNLRCTSGFFYRKFSGFPLSIHEFPTDEASCR